MAIRAEAILHQEVTLRLTSLHADCIVVPIPNGTYLPAHTPAERALVARLIARMKAEGQMLPGAGDMVALWRDGSGVIELKRPAERTLLGKKPAGRPSPAQREFATLCATYGVRHVYAHSWDEVRTALGEWGRIR